MTSLAQFFGSMLFYIYEVVDNYGLAIILFTILIKAAMLPLTFKQAKSMKKTQEIQPKIKELQVKYKNDKEKLNQKIMELYQEHNVSPFSSCLPLLIQFPIIIGLFTALRNPEVYVFESAEIYAAIDTSFLWLSSLAEADPWILPLLAGITTYLSSATMSAGAQGSAQSTQKTMNYIFPVMIFVMTTDQVFGQGFPAGLALYWVVSNTFQFVQQLVITKPNALFKGGTK
ncbi:YidC/Oxa1 family membrane protein insertase [Serpentinicella sp. ANB-PHB4]|uniref:YidC/Oxa1 family membrane protein insertase n=1 Tax=Serpentinicella sp. ANB-PHB4 TaxID=3074076 RepID=UPI0028640714|nr:YidC/Oxa1 family membrane protein insertase [Serpentinicella sp. ANB-PHB4]MDR5658908.1 YidC/Oxa1 family membrane protein insertase [Serpentinicella sp. ANB-PHB4]